MGKVALITGITGQDGSYLAEHLLGLGYEVHGIRRRSSSFNSGRIESLITTGALPAHQLHYADISDFSALFNVVSKVEPTEVYHLAAQSHVGISFENPEYTGNVDGLGTLRLLEALRILGSKDMRFYQASTSELYGKNTTTPQNELTVFKPCSPYAISKAFAFEMTRLYRDAYEIWASNGILFNHESPRRGETFVSRKITRHVARKYRGSTEVLTLGNLDSIRDWGHAKDYVKGMHLILNHAIPDDFVLATGVGHTVRDFADLAFAAINVDLKWEGEGLNECAFDAKTRTKLIQVSSSYFRPSEVPILIGDPSKAKNLLSWQAEISFEMLVHEMVAADIALFK
jgi:GDPmannose 4,6-dehydratase